MERSMFDRTRNLNDQVNRIDQAIALKRKILLNRSFDDGLRANIRDDINSLLQEREPIKAEILKLRLTQKTPKNE